MKIERHAREEEGEGEKKISQAHLRARSRKPCQTDSKKCTIFPVKTSFERARERERERESSHSHVRLLRGVTWALSVPFLDMSAPRSML